MEVCIMSLLTTTEEALEISDANLTVPAKHSATSNDMYQKSLIGKLVSVRGDLTAREDILVDGRLEGSITLKHNRLEVGVTGCIQADAFARVVVINGEMNGDVYAKDQVVITKTGRVHGNIFAGDIHIEDGALLKGSINMDMQDVIRDHFSEDDDEVEEDNSSAFGFLFKKSKALSHLDAEGHEYPANHGSDDNGLVLVGEHGNPLLDQSVIGKSVVIRGHIEAEEDVIIQGEIDGIVYFKNNSLEVGHQAKVCANIFVRSLIIFGDIKGDVYASDHIALRKPGHVFGTLRSPRVSIESGAILMGNVEMEQQDIEKTFANVDAAAVAAKAKANPVDKRTGSKHQDKANTVTDAQYTVTKPGVKAERVPWPE